MSTACCRARRRAAARTSSSSTSDCGTSPSPPPRTWAAGACCPRSRTPAWPSTRAWRRVSWSRPGRRGYSGERISTGQGVVEKVMATVREFEQPYGNMGAAQWFAQAAQRHMYQYGTTSEQLGHVAVTCRAHANLNPQALMRDKPMTLADHQASRMITTPFRLLDCSLESDGAGALVITSADRARSLGPRPGADRRGRRVAQQRADLGDPEAGHDDRAEPAGRLGPGVRHVRHDRHRRATPSSSTRGSPGTSSPRLRPWASSNRARAARSSPTATSGSAARSRLTRMAAPCPRGTSPASITLSRPSASFAAPSSPRARFPIAPTSWWSTKATSSTAPSSFLRRGTYERAPGAPA